MMYIPFKIFKRKVRLNNKKYKLVNKKVIKTFTIDNSINNLEEIE